MNLKSNIFIFKPYLCGITSHSEKEERKGQVTKLIIAKIREFGEKLRNEIAMAAVYFNGVKAALFAN